MIEQFFNAFAKTFSGRRLMRKETAFGIGVSFALLLLTVFAVSGDAKRQDKSDDCPRYCSTDAGVLGPYPNPGCKVKTGDACFGTDARGRRQEGTAVAGSSLSATDKSEDQDRDSGQDDCPHYCSTDAGILGPYPNPGRRVKTGDACFGTDKRGQRHEGTAVSGRERSEPETQTKRKSGSGKDDCPRYCATDAGVLGPYPNPDCEVKLGDACFGTDRQGRRREGTAVSSRDGNE